MMTAAKVFIAGAMMMVSLATQATDRVQFDYMMNCQGCHLPQGQGFPKRDVPAVNGHLGKFLHVEGGRDFLIQVPGSAQSDLNDERLTAVINWMLTTFSSEELPVNFQPYSVAEVSSLRKNPLIDVKGTRADLIEKIKRLNL